MLSFLSLLSLISLLPPTSPGPNDSLIIFNANRTYHFRAVFIIPNWTTTHQLLPSCKFKRVGHFGHGRAAD